MGVKGLMAFLFTVREDFLTLLVIESFIKLSNGSDREFYTGDYHSSFNEVDDEIIRN